MTILRLTSEQIKHFTEIPESAMGLHITIVKEERKRFVFVLGGLVLLIPDEAASKEISELMRQEWLQARGKLSDAERERGFNYWLENLKSAPALADPPWRRDILGLNLFLPPIIPPPTPASPGIYGHLPFSGATEANDVFYRCEPWPTSKRVNQSKNEIVAATYACPASELPFLPTGFAAVGRYALPNLLPACFRWELQPTAGSAVHCGASVPLYGQAGGGVEVRFNNLTKNRGPIANPVVLPAL